MTIGGQPPGNGSVSGDCQQKYRLATDEHGLTDFSVTRKRENTKCRITKDGYWFLCSTIKE